MDDYIPCFNKKPIFSRAHGNELWVLLLEKAWAKIHGSYDRIVAGQAHATLRDLTGAPAFEYIISKTDDLFEKILEADNKKYVIAAGCDAKNEVERQKLTALGLVGEHSYGIIEAHVVTNKKG